MVFLPLVWLHIALANENDEISSSSGNFIVPNLLFKRFYSSNGLPDERIRSIYQDHNGYLWIGTMNGICRYDGYTFKNFFKTKNDKSIAGNWAYTITEDASYNIWIGTNEGFSKFDQQTETFVNYTLPNQKLTQQSKRVNTLHFDKQGNLWIGGKLGLTQYNPKTNQFQSFKKPHLNVNISKIIESINGQLWIACDDGIVHFNTTTSAYEFFQLSIKPNAYGDKIWSLLEDKKDLYIATASSGLVQLPHLANGKYGSFKSLNSYATSNETLENTQVFDISKSATGDLWLGTERGLAKIEHVNQPQAALFYFRNNSVNAKSISSDRVYSVFIDKTNVLWCGTEVGLNNLHLSALPFHYYSFTGQKLTDQIRGVFTNDGKQIWLATYKSGFFNYNLETNTTTAYNVKPDNSSLNGTRSVLAQDNSVLIGSLNGIIKMANNGKSGYTNLLSGHAVFALYKDHLGNIWIGTNNGLLKMTSNGTITDYASKFASVKGFTSSFVRTVFEDANGNIWVGFENGGVGVIDAISDLPTALHFNNKQEGIFGSSIYSIAEYPKNTMWIGSESGLTKLQLTDGKNRFDNIAFKNFSIQNGLPDKSVNGILTDDSGHLWISTIKGLVKFNCATEICQNYLPNIYFNHSCCFKRNNHQFFFGTSDGFISFDPSAIVEDKFIPDVVISDIKLFNQPISINDAFNGQVVLNQSLSNTKKLVFNYKNNVFTLDFAALHFANPDQNKFAYMMEGFDKTWIQTTAANRSATYTNLDPGTYTFKLKAANYLGTWNEQATEITIVILPPFWKTWWAMTIYGILAIAFLYVFTKYVLSQIRQRHKLRYELMEKNQLKKLDAMKTQFFTDISHEFRTPLSLIVGPAEEMLTNSKLDVDAKHKAQLIHRNSKKLLYLIDELMTFQKLDEGQLQLKPQLVEMVTFVEDVFKNFQHLAEKKAINFTFNTDNDRYLANIDPGKMEMVLNNLLFNAFKYAPEKGSIQINIQQCLQNTLPTKPSRESERWLQVSVEDNGKGISASDFSHLFERYFQSNNAIKGTGVGLSLTKNLVELHGGVITANSTPGVKTSFAFFLPMGNQEATADIAETKNYILDYNVDDLVDDSVLTADEHLGRTKSKHNLLLVDDNVEVLDYLEMVFQNQYNVARAENGVLALEYLKDHEPDLIISDVMMPEMDGISLCKSIKNNVDISHIPVILLTAKATIENTLQGLQFGADDYMPKPFNPEVLKAKVFNFIEAKKRLIEKFTQTEGGVVIPKNITHNPLDEAFLQNVLEAINANMDNEEFSVEELGSMVAMSRSNLFRKLKAITGQTPVEFIYFIRMNKAMELLLERKHSISQISFEVGFKSPSSFTKSFKKQFGKAPTEFLNDAIAKQKEIDKEYEDEE